MISYSELKNASKLSKKLAEEWIWHADFSSLVWCGNDQFLKWWMEKGEFYSINHVFLLVRIPDWLPVDCLSLSGLVFDMHSWLFQLTIQFLCAISAHKQCPWNLSQLNLSQLLAHALCVSAFVLMFSHLENSCCLLLTLSWDMYMLPVLQNSIQKPLSPGRLLWSSQLGRSSPFFELLEDHIWLLSYCT